MQKDNVGDNISWMNNFVGPLTCMYWAWKNLNVLGNPEYIGLNHYRRLFPIRQYTDTLDKNDDPFIVVSARDIGIPVISYAELEYGIGNDLVTLFYNILYTDHERDVFNAFKGMKEFAQKNLFIIPTKELDGYMTFMMRAIVYLYSQFQYQYLEGMQYRRRTARMLEFVTAYYLLKLSVDKHYKRISINYEYPWRNFC